MEGLWREGVASRDIGFLPFSFFFLDSLFFGKMDASCLYHPRGVNNNFIIIYYGSFRCRLE